MKYRVVNSHNVLKEKRFDGSYHNAEVNVYNDVITSHSEHNLSYYCSAIFTSGRNRRVYTKPEFGHPFLSNSDAASLDPLATCKYSSKKYGYDEAAVLKGGMILTGRVGAIGQTTFVPRYWERYNAMGSDNIIRIVVKPEYKNGFIYAYLASKVGNLSFWKHATGGVQPFITDAMVGSLPIPQFPESFQKEVDDLMQESARLREEATDALEEAQKYIDDKFLNCVIHKGNAVPIKSIINSHNTRFEGQYYTSTNRSIYDNIVSHYEYKPLKEFVEKIFRPGIFKREYVQNGVTFLGGADIMMAIPDSDKKLSFKQVERMPELLVKRGWILVTCGGTIGNTVCIDNQLAKCAISQHVMRVVPKEGTLKGYLYAFLSSNTGHELINLYTSGSVIPQIEAHHLERVPVPIMDREIMNRINSLVDRHISNLEKSKENETKAISMVEQEIEKWNK
jgi:type I restriction enzyme, S subunit